MAVEFIFLAALLDAIDGRVARALKAESKIGGQLDSLADFFNFGIVPIMMIYFWQLNEIERLGWLVVILYTVCTALRLAKFNVLQDALSSDDGENMPIWTQNFFVGVPSPAGAGIMLIPIVITLVGNRLSLPTKIDNTVMVLIATVWIAVVSILLISNIRTISFKKFRFKIRKKSATLILVFTILLLIIF